MSKLARAIREMAHDYRRRASRARRLSRGLSRRDVSERLILYARWHERTAAEIERQVGALESRDDPDEPLPAHACPSAFHEDQQPQRGVPLQ